MFRTPLPCLGMLASLALSLAPSPAHARPAYRKALVDLLELPSASRLNDCRTCHLPDKPGAEPNDKPHNAFGKRLKAVRAELRKAGKPTDITARLLAVANEDSDGDGVPNLLELVTGHFPGDARDVPTAAQIVEGRKLQATLLENLRGYRWRPFERVERPALPAVKDHTQVRNPIDLFIRAEQERRGLVARPEAPKHILLRRVYLDLIGLPPTRAELHAFLADDSPDAYEKVVDRLLASPLYGERWGRHWMDVWRYADWAGYGAEVRDSRRHIWHWRDWIVESLNEDKGYDRMVLEMLAADELAPTDPKALRATGYLVRNFKLLSREKWLQDTVEHTAQGFLGITLGCARCHDHMYDPLTQKEYYQVRAIFTPHRVRTDRLPGFPDLAKNGLPRAYDADPTAPTFLFLRGDDRTPDKKPLPPAVPEALGGAFSITPVSLSPDAYAPGHRAFVVRETIAASENAVGRAKQALTVARAGMARSIASGLDVFPLRAVTRLAGGERAREALALAELDAALARTRHAALLAVLRAEGLDATKRSPEWVKAATEAGRAQRQVALLEARRALFMARQAERVTPPKARPAAARKVATAAKALVKAEATAKLPDGPAFTPRPVPLYPRTSTGRRLALARWITHRDNPLAARVAMNHIWLRHFGQAIVPSVFDFGRNGRPPSHPALLDWLAAELMERGWRMKEMHKLIVTSAAYRRASTPDRASTALDPDNRYLWRYAPRRVEAEVVRDSLFSLAGRLDLTMGGPDLAHGLGLVVPRRSLYFQHAAEKQMEFLLLFDAASVTECYTRTQSILPQQALALANSELALRSARLLARALAGEDGGDAGRFTTAAFEAVLSRPPTAQERAECVAFVAALTKRFAALKLSAAALDRDGALPASAPGLRARENLVQVLLNRHELVTIR